jgi:hypothetical protein
MKEKEESDFGRGLIVCLVKFSEHLHFEGHLQRIYAVERWIKGGMKDTLNSDTAEIELFKKVELKVYKDPERAFSHLIEMWANGASDHLYEIKVPKAWNNNSIGRNVRKLKNLGLTMGHGFPNKTYTLKDIEELRKLVRRIAIAIDKQIGIEDAEWGRW